MKKFLLFLCAVTVVFGMAGNASAASFTFDMGAGSTIDTSGTDNVLAMYATLNPLLDTISYPLVEGESSSFLFATIGTTETWINDDDLIPGVVKANVDFDIPDVTQAIEGESVGFSGFLKFTQGWELEWDDPILVNFGDGGQFAIELSDVGYQSGWWCGPDGSADVFATVTLNSAPIPEPATILLMGAGLLGLVGRSRKRLSKKS